MQSLNIVLKATAEIDKYPAKSHARRVAELVGVDRGLIVVNGTKSAYFSNSDQKQPFRQDRYFYYLTGCNEADCFVTYDIAEDLLTLYLPPVDFRRFFYDGRSSTVEEAMQKYDIDEARYINSKESLELLVSRRHDSASYKCFVMDQQHTQAPDRLHTGSDAAVLRRAMDSCRAIKDEHEIRLIRKANEITAAAHKDVLLQLHTLRTEAEAEAVYMQRCIASKAKEQAYAPIFGVGRNASFLHYVKNDAAFKDSPVLLIDAGCEWQCYASDVTRSLPLKSLSPAHWPSLTPKHLYREVERIQQECISLMRPGTQFSFVAMTAQHMAIEALIRLRVLKGLHEEILEAGTHRAFFPHGLGHHIGLEVHDVAPPAVGNQAPQPGALSPYVEKEHSLTALDPAKLLCKPTFDSTDPPMAPGMCITVEPGLYFNQYFLEQFVYPSETHSKFINRDKVNRYIPIGGIRIEDDILITKHGCENLTTAPKGAEVFEILTRIHGAKQPILV